MKALALSCMLLLAATQAARAGTITIEFDLSDSALSAGGIIEVPPNGGFPRASAIVRVPGAGISTPSGGQATLLSFVWSVTFNVLTTTAGVQLTFTGNIFLEGLEQAFGTLTPSLALLTFPQPARASYGFFLDCFPKSICNYGTSSFPVSYGGTTLSPPGSMQVGNLAQNGQATIMLTDVDTDSLILIVGREVSRTFAPEPSSGFTALGAIAAALGLALWRRPLRRSR